MQNAGHWLGELTGDDRMADLSFANDAGMQDGTGDGFYADFLHKYIAAISVSILQATIYS